MRNLLTRRVINDLKAIPNSDNLELAVVDGWEAVVKRGEFTVGQAVYYAEVDSMLPGTDERFSFFVNRSHRIVEGIKYHRVKTIKLRGTLSQGILFGAQQFPELDGLPDSELASKVGIIKYEPYVPVDLAGQMAGYLPAFIRKTDQERVQNLTWSDIERGERAVYEVTVKMDGSSITVFNRDGEVGVCSRNVHLKLNEANQENAFVKAATETGLIKAVAAYGKDLAVQGELCGPGLNGNRHRMDTFDIFVFDIFDIATQQYLPPADRYRILDELRVLGYTGSVVPLKPIGIAGMTFISIKDMLDQAASLVDQAGNPLEGLVYKRFDGQFSFKVINNNYLLKHDL